MKYSKMILFAVAAAVALLEVGCASVNRQATNAYAEPKADQGVVYFFRPKKFMGAAVSYDVRDRANNTVIGAIANGTYFFHYATPGQHVYAAATETDTLQNVEVEAGKTYYIECGVQMGVLAGRPSMKVVPEADAKPVLLTLQYATK
ncbi:MAG: DUF2846 domain-containing protein [Candidatus Didemnitutus sp.]|nr:DUF2846 domain-containing protein [Candidatus Didemnitutus sp.]